MDENEQLTPDRENSRPLTSEQIVEHKRPGDPQISPDGSKILFTLRPISKSGEHDEAAIWAIDFRTGDPAQFSSGLAEDEEPRWSPDGTRIAFLSDRAERGKKSVYILPASGGEAIRAFDHEGDLESLKWSPDGTLLGVLYTEPQTDEEKKREEERDDVHVWDTDYKFQRLWVIDPEKKQSRCISPPERQVVDYAWSPDGERIAFNSIATPRIDEIFKHTDVSIISRSGGEPEHIHTPRGATHDLVWSADGSHLAWIGPAGRAVSAEVVLSVPVTGGDAVCLTPEFPGTVESISAIGAGEHLLMQTAEGFHSALYQLSWSGERHQLSDCSLGGSMPRPASVSSDGKRIAFIWESSRSAPDLWVLDRQDGSEAVRRTRLNPELEAAALGEAELVCWENGDGEKIEGMLVKPHGYVEGRRYPLVTQVHGGPTARWSEEFTATWHDWAQSLAGRGIAVLMPNPRGSTGRGSLFTNAIYNDVGGGEFRDMMTGVDAIIERGIADPDRLGIGGWSWGGYMTAWTITQTNRFKAAIMGAGLPNMVSDNGIGDIPTANLSYFEKTVYDDPEPYWERSAMKHLRNVQTPTLILHGEQDRRVAMPQGLELYTGLKTLGVETQFVTYPREPHGIQETRHQKDLIERVVNWYTRHLKP